MNILAFLDNISPWWWVVLGLAIGALEVATGSTYLLGPAVAALAVAGIVFLYPDIDGVMQLTVFGVAVLLSAILAWLVTRRMKPMGGLRGLNRRGDALAGRMAEVTAPFKAGIGSVSVDGVVWRARLTEDAGPSADEPLPGSAVRISGVEGATLLVEPQRGN
ncbi:MAG: NfeD family protein [Pseudomonadota bacterium]